MDTGGSTRSHGSTSMHVDSLPGLSTKDSATAMSDDTVASQLSGSEAKQDDSAETKLQLKAPVVFVKPDSGSPRSGVVTGLLDDNSVAVEQTNNQDDPDDQTFTVPRADVRPFLCPPLQTVLQAASGAQRCICSCFCITHCVIGKPKLDKYHKAKLTDEWALLTQLNYLIDSELLDAMLLYMTPRDRFVALPAHTLWYAVQPQQQESVHPKSKPAAPQDPGEWRAAAMARLVDTLREAKRNSDVTLVVGANNRHYCGDIIVWASSLVIHVDTLHQAVRDEKRSSFDISQPSCVFSSVPAALRG